jgi:hypothetical protein
MTNTPSKGHNGGPAFPHIPTHGSVDGMTLRDYFAGQALAGLSADPSATDNTSQFDMAKWCYQMADAMLLVRQLDIYAGPL